MRERRPNRTFRRQVTVGSSALVRAAIGIAAVAVLGAPPVSAVPTDPGRAWPEAAAAVDTPGVRAHRPFAHSAHKTLACGQCHTGKGATLSGSGEAWCAGCHHAPDSGVKCARCHSALLQATLKVAYSMSLPRGPAERSLYFSHASHEGEGCATCHGKAPKRIDKAPCGDCHADDHAAFTACRDCHGKPPSWAHEPATVHAGCGGGPVCHAPLPAGVSPKARPACLLCHPEFPKAGALPAPPIPPVGDSVRKTTASPARSS